MRYYFPAFGSYINMKKKSHKTPEKDNNSEEEAEMNVDHDEQKIEHADATEDSVDDDESNEENANADDDEHDPDERQATGVAGGDDTVMPFLDTFYGLSSADGSERAQAAQQLIQLCLLGPDANTKDASYAFRRLLNGLCSGRAAARQGNASALAVFLKVAHQTGYLTKIQAESAKAAGESTVSDLIYVRRRLLAATELSETGQASGGRRKVSEERDYKFGRLFGILGVVRSGILLPKNGSDVSELIDVASNYMNDLADLYAYKKWMREPAAHAMGNLLNSFYANCGSDPGSVKIATHLVEEVIVPVLLIRGDLEDTDTNASLVSAYSAEQMAIALNIQSNIAHHAEPLPKPIDVPILTKDTIPLVANVLSDTCSVTQPRTHLVWDAIFMYLTESIADAKDGNVDVRRARQSCPVGHESVDDFLDSIISRVIEEKLLGIEGTGKSATSKTTHDRSALALSIIRTFSGVEFASSITGRTRVLVKPDFVENVLLKTNIVRHLFINILSAGMSGKKSQSAHLLRPMALDILLSIANSVSFADEGPNDTDDERIRKRLAIVRPLLTCDPRFDAKTKTTVISQLLSLEKGHGEGMKKFWEEYQAFLEHRVALSSVDTIASGRTTVYDAQGYVELLFNFAKAMLRALADHEGNERDYFSKAVRRVLHFLQSVAFFDCKQEKKGAKLSRLPYLVRSVASARFFSLLAEYVAIANHSGREKEKATFSIISEAVQSIKDLESMGATGLAVLDEDNEASESKVLKLRKKALKLKSNLDDAVAESRNRFTLATSAFASTLYLHLMSCGQPEDAMDEEDPDMDDEEDAEAVHEFLNELVDVHDLFNDSKKESGDNPLTSLVALCANVLSSPLSVGNQSRGGSPKLLREIVKMVWVAGLQLTTAQKAGTKIEKEALAILLGSIGSESGEKMDEEELEEDDDGSDVDKNSSDSEGGEDFKILEGEVEHHNEKGKEDSEQDVEIEPSKLQSFLEEDSDASISGDDLEHHEGADAALAKLIELKNEARKAGQMARERIEIAKQLRCTILLETLVIGKADGWGALLTTDALLDLILPLLRYRGHLERSLEKASGKLSETGIGEKRALLERITSILKTKILKAKFSALQWSDSVHVLDFSSPIAAKLVAEMKRRASKEHRSCCSVALTALIRAIPGCEEKIQIASKVYQEALEEWATKRTTRIETSMFEDLLNHSPVVAQAVLIPPLATCAVSARSAFLKSESFRLLSMLYNPKISSDQDSELEIAALRTFAKATENVLAAFAGALNDSEMKKSKRAREMLKGLEKVFAFLTASDHDFVVSEKIGAIRELLIQLKSSTDSQALENISGNLIKTIDNILADKGSKSQKDSSELSGAKTKGTSNHEEDAVEDAKPKHISSSGGSSKKQKKRSKKKRKH